MRKSLGAILIVFTGLLTSEVVAEDQQPIDISRDWSTFECYIVSGAIEMMAFKNGEKLSKVSRDKGRLYVQKDNKKANQIAGTYFAGFPLKTASQALLTIDDKESFVLYSHPEPQNSSEKPYAWSHPQDDTKLIAALKKGSKAVIESNSHTGKVIKDTFALTGFTSAYNLMLKTCK
ncbi:MAG: invasion associated locus B family protein [Pseudomonadota bacterium]|nr:invasion associated locus B family protein [Pseudomonadota bacterium]